MVSTDDRICTAESNDSSRSHSKPLTFPCCLCQLGPSIHGISFGAGGTGGRLTRISLCRQRANLPPVPPAPNDMPWIDGPNWHKQQGNVNGLECDLEESLLSAVQIRSSVETIADLRREACLFLMEQLSPGELDRLWNRLPWMRDFSPGIVKHQNIRLILQEATN